MKTKRKAIPPTISTSFTVAAICPPGQFLPQVNFSKMTFARNRLQQGVAAFFAPASPDAYGFLQSCRRACFHTLLR